MKIKITAIHLGGVRTAAFVAVADRQGHHLTYVGGRKQTIDVLVVLTVQKGIGKVADIVHDNAVTHRRQVCFDILL